MDSSNRFLPLIEDDYPSTHPQGSQSPTLTGDEDQDSQTTRLDFSALLPELRLEIYEHIFHFPAHSTLHSIFRASAWVIPCLAVSREMRHAGLRTIYARTKLHLDIVSYQFAPFESIACGSDSRGALHRPFLVLDRRTMAFEDVEGYEPEQFYDRCVLPLPSTLFRPEWMREVSLVVHLGMFRDDNEGVSMKVVFKLLHRLTHLLILNLERVTLRVAGGHARACNSCGRGKGWTARLLASEAEAQVCKLLGKDGEARRQRWLDSLPEQIGKLPIKVKELQLEGVSDEVFEVIAGCAKVSG